jgi:Ser/Thr protein kinase RdoA (MazF antagonist)
VSGYRRHAEITPAERERLADAVAARPLMFAAWRFATGAEQLSEVVEQLPGIRAKARTIAERALTALDEPV